MDNYADMSLVNIVLLVVAALVPAIALAIFIFIKDRVEKEPIGLLLLLLLSGVLIIPPVIIVGTVLETVSDTVFGFLPSTGLSLRLYYANDAFINVALVEEGFKWLALIIITKRNKNFNSLFDGIIYATFVSLGFAAAENVLYCVQNGWSTAIIRAVLSVPGHMFFGVLMGLCYSLWHMYQKACVIEKDLKSKGLIEQNAPVYSYRKYAFLSLFLPILAHGVYDYCCFVGTPFATLILYSFVIFLYIFCFIRIGKMSRRDVSDVLYAKHLVVKKYPELLPVLYEEELKAMEKEETTATV